VEVHRSSWAQLWLVTDQRLGLSQATFQISSVFLVSGADETSSGMAITPDAPVYILRDAYVCIIRPK
jgi:hypothetical protein